MPDLNVIDNVASKEKVFFSAWVQLEKEDGSELQYRIVGPDEIDSDLSRGYISVDSPLARALLHKSVDEEVELKIADKTEVFYIVGIRYN